MQNMMLRFAVALLTFGFGVSVTMFWIGYRTPDVKTFEVATHPLPPVAPPVGMMIDEPPAPPPGPVGPITGATISGGVLNGKAISKPAPAYPAIAGAARASGTVVVQVVLDEAGRVVMANAVSGHPLLREAATQAAYQARFTPTLLGKRRVKVSGVVTYNFVPQQPGGQETLRRVGA